MNKWGSEKNASSIDREGLNHAGQQTFAQDSIRGFVREMLQNSLDAKRDSDIVEISSNYTQLNKTDFPDFEGLKKIFLLVEKYFKKENDIADAERKTATDFFNRFRKEIGQSKFPVLTWCDFGTSGLSWNDGTFKALVRHEGVSAKQSPDSLGGFGIGKSAALNMSMARTVLYSTQNVKGDYLFQGLSRLSTYKDDDDKPKNHRIYFGKDDGQFGPVDKESELPHGLMEEIGRKGKAGLSFMILFPNQIDDWAEILAKEVLFNFWPALHDKTIRIKARDHRSGNTIEIGGENGDILNEANKIFGESQDSPVPFMRAFNSGKHYQRTIKYLGKVELRLNVDDDGNGARGIALLRDGMVIKRQKPHGFGTMNYAGVFRCLDAEGNRFLKRMEPVAHDNFSPDAFENKGYDKREALSVLREMKSWFKEVLNQYEQGDDEGGSVEFIDNLFQGVDGMADEEVRQSEGVHAQPDFGPITTDFSTRRTVVTLGSSVDGSEFVDSGGALDGEGAGGLNRGEKTRKKGKNNRGAGPYGGGRSGAKKVRFRMFQSAPTQDGNATYRFALMEGLPSTELRTIKIEQLGDDGRTTNHFDFNEIRDVTSGEKLNADILSSGALVVSGVLPGNVLEISLREQFAGQFNITGL